MRAFSCPHCSQLVFFENSVCLRCGTALGFDSERREIVEPGNGLVACANLDLAGCNWLVPDDDGTGMCRCCRLTRTRPQDDDLEGLAAFHDAEEAKRRLVFQLLELGLPVEPLDDDTGEGLAFDLLSTRHGPVTTGHQDGVVTLDLSESDDAHRTQVRLELNEAYRTMLGHFRHEIGHYYETVLVDAAGRTEEARAVFGDEQADYQAAIDRHYAEGPPAGWEQRFVSAYATMHPWEDFAETFARVLHILDTMQTAASFGMKVDGPNAALAADPAVVAEAATETRAVRAFDAVLREWLPLTYALNAVNRSMGRHDLYPFVLSDEVIAKLAFVHDAIVRGSTSAVRQGAPAPADSQGEGAAEKAARRRRMPRRRAARG
jgi:hypothetical protein